MTAPRRQTVYHPLPPGDAGSAATLGHMARMIRESVHDPIVASLSGRVTAEMVVARHLFNFVQRHVLRYPDEYGPEVAEEIRTPGHMLEEIGRLGHTLGDCDDMTTLLGALYHGLGWPVTLIGVWFTRPDQDPHVYLEVELAGRRIAADPLVPEPFGWSVPAEEVARRMEWVV